MSFAASEMSFTVSEMSLAILAEMSFGQNAQKKSLLNFSHLGGKYSSLTWVRMKIELGGEIAKGENNLTRNIEKKFNLFAKNSS